MSHRPLALVSGLTLGDYLLWNWSLSGGHDVVALVSGLTLPPLAVAFVWLLALDLARVLARFTRRPTAKAGEHRRGLRDADRGRGTSSELGGPNAARVSADNVPASASASSADKLAA